MWGQESCSAGCTSSKFLSSSAWSRPSWQTEWTQPPASAQQKRGGETSLKLREGYLKCKHWEEVVTHLRHDNGFKKEKRRGNREVCLQEKDKMFSPFQVSFLRGSQSKYLTAFFYKYFKSCFLLLWVSCISKHAPGSESRSSSPHRTQTPSHRILGRSLRPGHLSAHERNSFTMFLSKARTSVHALVARKCQNNSWIYLLCTGVSVILQSGIRQNKPVLLPLQGNGRFKYRRHQRKVSSQAYGVSSRTTFVFLAAFHSLETDSDSTKRDRRDRNRMSRPAVPLHCRPVWTSIPSWSSGGQAAKQRVHTVTVLELQINIEDKTHFNGGKIKLCNRRHKSVPNFRKTGFFSECKLRPVDF